MSATDILNSIKLKTLLDWGSGHFPPAKYPKSRKGIMP